MKGTGNARAGFVLVGGASSRMGEDKALLTLRGRPLVEHISEEVRTAAGSVCLVGAPDRYAHLSIPAIPDLYPGCGPLGGILTALESSAADWNLVVACDMPAVDCKLLKLLLETAEGEAPDCLIPTSGEDRLEPLCAVYRKSSAGHIRNMLQQGVRKVTDGLAGLRIRLMPMSEVHYFQNVNTPGEWAPFHE